MKQRRYRGRLHPGPKYFVISLSWSSDSCSISLMCCNTLVQAWLAMDAETDGDRNTREDRVWVLIISPYKITPKRRVLQRLIIIRVLLRGKCVEGETKKTKPRLRTTPHLSPPNLRTWFLVSENCYVAFRGFAFRSYICRSCFLWKWDLILDWRGWRRFLDL